MLAAMGITASKIDSRSLRFLDSFVFVSSLDIVFVSGVLKVTQ